MFNLNLLENPQNSIYNLEESEQYLLKEAKELIEIEHYLYSLQAIFNCVIINLQRRIEHFGVENFINILDSKEEFNQEGNNLKDRWLKINNYAIIEYARKLNIINHTVKDLVSALYWMKSNTNENEIKNVTRDEILALIFLLEKNLFLLAFKEDKRNHENINNVTKFRRKADKENEIINLDNLHFQNQIKNSKNSYESTDSIDSFIIDKYV